MYDKLKVRNQKGELLKSHHHVSLDVAFKLDCSMWIKFLQDTQKVSICRPFIDLDTFQYAQDLFFSTDASLNPELGMGGVFDTRWIVAKWDSDFIKQEKPSIEFLELFALCAGVLVWSNQLMNNRFIIYCDNQAAMSMVNNSTSSCPKCMKLIRCLVLNGMRYNRRILVRYVKSSENVLSDSLSRLDFKRFWRSTLKGMNRLPDPMPKEIWPIEKIWFG